MSTAMKKGKTKSRSSPRIVAARSARATASGTRPGARRKPLNEAEATLDAIRAGQIDALVIQGEESEKIYALKTFVELEQTQAALENAGVERRRSRAQIQALAEERERLFQDMHDGCIQSIYAVGLNLEACMGIMEANPKKAAEMVADATASLSLVIQELRSFITGHRLQIAKGEDLAVTNREGGPGCGQSGRVIYRRHRRERHEGTHFRAGAAYASDRAGSHQQCNPARERAVRTRVVAEAARRGLPRSE